jgi:hypothetical protein
MTRTSRTNFNESWLSEMPNGIGGTETYSAVNFNIRERIKYGSQVTKVNDNLFKIIGHQTAYYWYQENDVITLGTELQITPQALVVTMTGKNPSYNKKPPYASDLYNGILQDNDIAIRLYSDTKLSDEGYSIWKRLFKMGNNVSIYDSNSPGTSFKTFHSQSEMDQFFEKNSPEHERYQYVLSRKGEMLAETNSFFNTRRYRELSGVGTED